MLENLPILHRRILMLDALVVCASVAAISGHDACRADCGRLLF